jgi:hypothetical protein
MNFKFLSRLFAIPLLAAGISLGQAAPAFGDLTLSSLVPAATVPLNPPVTCATNGVTVFDSEDLASLCLNAPLALPILGTCPQPITSSGFFKLTGDVTCLDQTWITVGADNVVIDLNGHTVTCVGPGFQASCQEDFPANDDFGVDTNGHNNVHVFSSQPGGTIKNFVTGVFVNGGSNVKVKQLLFDGPPRILANDRPPSQGIRVKMANASCNGNIRIGGGVQTGNEVRNYTEGIEVDDSSCVEIGFNNVHDNNSDPHECHGIVIEDSAHLNIHHNNVHNNGEGLATDGGLTLRGPGTTDVLVTGNTVGTSITDANNGDGISVRNFAHGNNIVNNVMKHNAFFDAAARPPSSPPLNFWGQNNDCITQTTPEPPPGTCTATS